ncbi:dnaJ homolog subfamily C member 4 [Vombatus ursinus]|uniref:dnaJ homolog subfamily C member 4 n=1 Tax=Vombatus ursinus TaxID=29139 RepID=UPI000FFD2952|nr:dnaJ homolog subfamily C member 4 [Vombatus ursinus]
MGAAEDVWWEQRGPIVSSWRRERGVARAGEGNGGAGVGLWSSRTEMPLLRLVPHLCQLCPRCPPSARPLSSTVCLRARQSNYYELLGIRPDASMKEVKRAFFAKSKELHPDRDPKNPALHNQFVELNEAYRVLSKESSRRDYDSRLDVRGSTPPPYHTSQSPYQSYRPASASASASASGSSSWSSADARYWAQFHRVRPEDYGGSRQRQQRQNHQVLGYCLLLMVGGMVMHYIAFSWSRSTEALWMRRTELSWPSTTRAEAGPGRTAPGSSRRDCRSPRAPSRTPGNDLRPFFPSRPPAPERVTGARCPSGPLLPVCNKVIVSGCLTPPLCLRSSRRPCLRPGSGSGRCPFGGRSPLGFFPPTWAVAPGVSESCPPGQSQQTGREGGGVCSPRGSGPGWGCGPRAAPRVWVT